MSNSDDLASRGARGAVYTVGSQFIQIVTRLGGTIVLARLISPEVFGVVAIVIAINGLLVTFTVLGRPMAAIQAHSLTQSNRSWLFLLNLGSGLVVGLGQYLLAPVVAALYGASEIEPVMRWMALATVLAGLQGQAFAELSRGLRAGKIAGAELVGQLVGTASAVIIALNGMQYVALIALNLAPQAVSAIAMILWARWSPTIPSRWGARETSLVNDGVRIYSMQFMPVISRQALLPIAGLYLPSAALGNYDRAQQQSTMPIALTVEKLQRVVVPVLSRVRHDRVRFTAYFESTQRLLAYSTALIYGLIAAVSHPLVYLLFGPGWELAGSVLQILSIGGAFRAVVQSTQWLFIAVGEPTRGLRLAVWSYPTITITSLVGIPIAGATGMAALNSIAWMALWPISIYAACRAAGIRSKSVISTGARAMFALTLPSSCAAWLVSMQFSNPWVAILVGIATFAIVVSLIVAIIPPIRRDQLAVRRSLANLRRGGGTSASA